jgi:23S rRNA pseudouridine955/2504/2580 synthase
MMAKRFTKIYHALVAPDPPAPDEGLIDRPLRRDEVGREAYMRVCDADHPDAETAQTRYRKLERGDGAALMEMSPLTGRMHQIRVHLAALGRPILGDVRYGGALTSNGAPVPRLMLHARRLSFPHPDGEAMTLEAPWPIDFAAVAGAAGIGKAG